MGIFRSVRQKLVSAERPSQSAFGPSKAGLDPTVRDRWGAARSSGAELRSTTWLRLDPNSPLGKRNRPLLLASPAQMCWTSRSDAKFLVVPSSRSLGPRPVRSTLCRRSAKLDPTNLRQSTTKHLCSSSFFVDIFKRSRPQATRSGKHPVALKYTN